MVDGKYATAAGVSAGLDLALDLVGRIAGPEVAQLIRLGIEYDPAPPFDAGSPGRAPAPPGAVSAGPSRPGRAPVKTCGKSHVYFRNWWISAFVS